MTAPTTLHLVRHATYNLLGHRLAGRSLGHHLGPEGRLQAEAVADDLAERPLAAVIASPLERAQETAAPIAARHRLVVGTEPGLTEIDFGEWTGAPFEDLAHRVDWHAFNVFRSTALVPGGELMLQAQARALTALMRLRAAWPGREIAVVSHADVIKAILAHWLAVPLDLFHRLEIAPASRSIVVLHDTDAQVLGVNWPPSAREHPA